MQFYYYYPPPTLPCSSTTHYPPPTFPPLQYYYNQDVSGCQLHFLPGMVASFDIGYMFHPYFPQHMLFQFNR